METHYRFDELSDEAKEKAREWYRQDALDYDWWDSTCDDFSEICKLIGIDLDTKPIRLMNGGIRYESKIYFSGFYSQGDGASFFGEYYYKKGALAAVKKYAPKDEKLHKIINDLQDIQRKHFYQLSAKIESRSSHYCHSGTMNIYVYRDGEDCYGTEAYETVCDCLRGLADWLYRRLRVEYEYLMSDESIDDSILANEFTFDVDGNIEY